MLLNRYNDITYVMDLSFVQGVELIGKAKIKMAEDMLFAQWNMEHIFMDEKNFIAFEDYKDKAFKGVNKKKLSKEEIHKMAVKAMEEADKIKKEIEEGGYVSETI